MNITKLLALAYFFATTTTQAMKEEDIEIKENHNKEYRVIKIDDEIKEGRLIKLNDLSFPPIMGSIDHIEEHNNLIYQEVPPTTSFEDINFQRIEGTDFYWNSSDGKTVLISKKDNKLSFFERKSDTSYAGLGLGPIIKILKRYTLHRYNDIRMKSNNSSKLIHYIEREDMDEKAIKILKKFEKKSQPLKEQIEERKDLYTPLSSQPSIYEDVKNSKIVLVVHNNKGYLFKKISSVKNYYPLSREYKTVSSERNIEKTNSITSYSFLNNNNFIHKIEIFKEWAWYFHDNTYFDTFSEHTSYIGDLANLEIEIKYPGKPKQFTNITELSSKEILKLKIINGISVEDIEENCRPGKNSTAGFLGNDESLLKCLAEDSQFVEAQGLTHAELAYPLQLITSAFDTKKISSGAFIYQGKTFSLKVLAWKGAVCSPFGSTAHKLGDNSTGSTDYMIRNLTDGTGLVVSSLGIKLISLYGFYEGKESPFRLEPSAIINVFGLKARIQL